jgi:hypothetical protein
MTIEPVQGRRIDCMKGRFNYGETQMTTEQKRYDRAKIARTTLGQRKEYKRSPGWQLLNVVHQKPSLAAEEVLQFCCNILNTLPTDNLARRYQY